MLVFDFTSSTQPGKPGTPLPGCRPIRVEQNDLFAVGDTALVSPDEQRCRAVARSIGGQLLALDIERLKTDAREVSEQEVKANVATLGRVADWIHDENPGVRLGFYLSLPIRDYWDTVNYQYAMARPADPWSVRNLSHFTDAWKRLQAANDLLRPLAEKVDCIFPSLYNFYLHADNGALYARGMLAEARRFGKQVYPFVWAYDRNDRPVWNTLLPADYWRKMLAEIEANADGLVLYDLWDRKQPWDENAGWWQTLKREMK